MFVIAAPGQGSQKPGFLKPWLADSTNADTLRSWSDSLGIDLVAHGTTSDEDTIKDTAVAQPLIVAAGILTGRALLARLPGGTPLAFAGHSVGEFTAAALSGVLSDHEALELVALRGRAMAEASQVVDSGMAALLGGDPETLEADVISRGLHPANYNGGGQLVVAGTQALLADLAESPIPGTRVIPLSVAGAFHTSFMESAQGRLSDAASTLSPADPQFPLYTNRDGSLLGGGQDALHSLVTQVTRPVRWDSCMESFATDGIRGMMELSPAGALVGLAKRGLKGVPSVALNTPEDLENALEMVAAA